MMHHQIVFTPDDVIAIVHSVCTMIGEIAVVAGALVAFFAWLRKPKEKRLHELDDHEKRITTCEGEIDGIKKDIEESEKEFERMDRSDRVFQRGLLALINHSLDGNNVDEMETVRDELRADIFGCSGASEKAN
jgi:flagellar motility protein MotE (MotC chaperone)